MGRLYRKLNYIRSYSVVAYFLSLTVLVVLVVVVVAVVVVL